MIRAWDGTLLTNAQWAKMEPQCLGSGSDNRRFIEAVPWVASTGSPWRDLPAFSASGIQSSSDTATGSKPMFSFGFSRPLEPARLIENFFCKLKEFKRIALRAETDTSFSAIIHLAAAVISSRGISTGLNPSAR